MILIRFRRFDASGQVVLESPVIRVPDIAPDGRDSVDIVLALAQKHFGSLTEGESRRVA